MIRTHYPFKHPSVLPPRRGLYVRDWRGTKVLPVSDRALAIDLWWPEPNPKDILHPGVWYVYPNVNDASEQRLPWREPTIAERSWWFQRYPEARNWRRI